MRHQDRSCRWQGIQEGLKFIHGVTAAVFVIVPFFMWLQVFIRDLVKNLFGEGNDVFSEGEWTRAVELYTEALNIAEYAETEDIIISSGIREKLYANRAAAYLNIGFHDQALGDCEQALQLNSGNYRALYRKAMSLKEMGRHSEAYEAVAKCSLAVPQDARVIELTHELAQVLGLKIRKAYRSRVRVYVPYVGSVFSWFCQSILALHSVGAIPIAEGPIPLPTSMSATVLSAPLLMPSHISHPFMNVLPPCTVNLPAPYHKTSSYSIGLDTFPSPLDSLDSLSLSDGKQGTSSEKALLPPIGMSLNISEGSFSRVDLSNNPLSDTHEFKQACAVCYVKTGPGVLDYTHYTDDHKCRQDLLLGRIRYSGDNTWKLIRPRSTKNQYVGPYYICKDVAMGEECRYPGHCTFAYCQEEIDVWTLERKGFLCRELLCDPYGSRKKMHLTVSAILQEHHGTFMFLCEVCFDHKPRIISKTNKDNPSLCSHPVTKHSFEDKKCMVHILKESTVRFSKIRPYNSQHQMDLCRHEVRYGCQREDFCFYAHSLIELKVWMLQSEQGISHESIVQEAQKYWNVQELPVAFKKFGPQNLKLQFVCGQCWRNGQVSEPDKNRKYCSAKARHPWAKDRRVVLVQEVARKKWTTVRPLPTKKPVPSQFEICNHVLTGKKCQYVGNCTFAHGIEEKDLWTYMKDNNIADMEQLYELWLQSQKPGYNEDSSSSSVRENGKQIHMPTDYAEEVAGNHCWLCGKNCNSEKQWQQHITSDKHKERVFNSEDDQNCWQYRFPTGTFKVCERFLKGTCTEEEHCKLAHGEEELTEWKDRREFLLMKLAKARKDHLISPNDNDFGKYSFLLKDI
uniref:C3H1-type domain-containing protein n=1 Tax=Denticeps clupeoides TaxID=299321 RepID=A0AAY4CQZ7_9TELE